MAKERKGERFVYQSFSSRLQEARRSVSGYTGSSEYKGTAIYRLAEAVERIHSRISNLQLQWQADINFGKYIGDSGMTELEKYDTNGNGVIDPDELALIELEDRRRRMEDEDAHRDAQRRMAWFALVGLLLYPFGIFMADVLSMGTAAQLIADIAPTYFASIAVLVSAFFGAAALKAKKES